MPDLRLISNSPDETISIGKAIGDLLHAGDFVALIGHLGAGKTHLTKGLVAGLGYASSDEVNSPTFVLINEYSGRVPIFHIDAYRLSEGRELSAIGFDELCSSPGVVILEWADRVLELVPEHALWIELHPSSENSRQLSVRTSNETLARALASARSLDQFHSPDDKSTP